MFERLKQARQSHRERSDLQRLVAECRRLLTERGEANSAVIAQRAIDFYRQLTPDAVKDFFGVLADEYDPDPGEVLRLAEQYAVARSPENLIELARAAEPPRQELLRRLNRAPQGTATIVAMRAQLLQRLRQDKRLRAVDADFEHLLSSWFNPGFLRLEQVDWTSSARLLEQIIQHEAVHEIDGWSDLRRRLEPDRRCFAFFPPALPDEPLIFVEVALVPQMPDAIAPLLDRKREADRDTKNYKVAVFYSISNCEPGLRGINLGNFLIKRVAERLQLEFPKLKTFCTLSPLPGFRRWLERAAPALAGDGAPPEAQREPLLKACARYLVQEKSNGLPLDPVAQFHLHNGASIDRIFWAADASARGQAQSRGLMVSYRYEPAEVDHNHEEFLKSGHVAAAKRVLRLL